MATDTCAVRYLTNSKVGAICLTAWRLCLTHGTANSLELVGVQNMTGVCSGEFALPWKKAICPAVEESNLPCRVKKAICHAV